MRFYWICMCHSTSVPYNDPYSPYSQLINWYNFSIFPILELLLILHVGVSAICIFNGDFSAECTIRQPSKIVAAISDDAIVSVILFRDWMVVKISEMRKFITVLPGVSRKYNPPFQLVIPCIIFSFAMRWSRTNIERLIWTNVRNLWT